MPRIMLATRLLALFVVGLGVYHMYQRVGAVLWAVLPHDPLELAAFGLTLAVYTVRGWRTHLALLRRAATALLEPTSEREIPC